LEYAVSLHDFRQWLLERSWKVDLDIHALQGLYAATQGRIMRFTGGPWSERELRRSIAYAVAMIDR
jgi:hypothetical protein